MNKRPLFQTLLKVFDISRNTPLTSAVGLLSNAVYILCVIESSWAIHESPGRKADSEEEKSLLLWIENYSFKILVKMGSKLMGQ